jgi:hypothetical protein
MANQSGTSARLGF